MRRLLLIIALVLVPASAQSNPYDDYKTLTRAERRLALRYFWQLGDVKGAAEFARAESERTFPTLVGQDDPRDALRHSLWNGSMVRRLKSREAAERWATAHEDVPGNPAQRQAMDLFNNAAARDAAWALRTTSGGWFRRTRFPDDGAIRGRMFDALRTGELRVIEEVAGQRDPQNGRLVPSYVP
jgi:hypothetical protein